LAFKQNDSSTNIGRCGVFFLQECRHQKLHNIYVIFLAYNSSSIILTLENLIVSRISFTHNADQLCRSSTVFRLADPPMGIT